MHFVGIINNNPWRYSSDEPYIAIRSYAYILLQVPNSYNVLTVGGPLAGLAQSV
jgi:hypothetical protein